MKKRRFHSSAEARSCLLSCASISHTHSFSPRCGFKFQFGVTQSSSYNNVFYHISFRCLQLSRLLSAEACYQRCDQRRRACGCQCAPIAPLQPLATLKRSFSDVHASRRSLVQRHSYTVQAPGGFCETVKDHPRVNAPSGRNRCDWRSGVCFYHQSQNVSVQQN